ncbi:glycogen(starch) synthase [Catalinimonas alkaloidigena]|uniref:glycosyltransferase family 4 protein n=1 Tax=Catalinimonas alkaloidigena TaxID=1075417 RepID=UPI00240567AB|nr:glycosyltransferase family 4 protein [Catalinimonas alkaloidigena]MDF9795102.1 glycogen(starch) synthase [Catalinimonas alkaloidigena]
MAQSCDRIVHHLREGGVQIDIIHFSQRKKAYQWQVQKRGRYMACPFEVDAAHTLNKLWNKLSEEKELYSHLVAFGGNLPILAASVYPTWMQTPLVTLFRGNDFDAAMFSTRRQPILLRAIQQSAAIGAVSQDKVIKIQRLFPEHKVFYTPNGIDTTNWRLSSSDLEKAMQWRKEIAPDRKVIGLFGDLKAKKGVPFFLEAIRKSSLTDHLHLLLVGNVEDTLLETLQEEPAIRFSSLGFLDRYELLGYYPACDAIAIPSYYDGMPNVMLEAGSLGVPLITSAIDGMKDVLINDEEQLACLFHAGDVRDAARALKWWYSSPEQAKQQKAARCQRIIKERFNHKQEVANYLEIFHQTLKRP